MPNTLRSLLPKPPANYSWCPDCEGEGQTFLCQTNNPSERPKWRTCVTCEGEGLLKLPEPDPDT
jgi:DnaJ-class molecular chaperone